MSQFDEYGVDTNTVHHKKSVLREYVEAIVVAAILALFIRTFLVQAYKIPSGSMEDTLLIGDHLLVNKFVYGTRVPFTDKKFFPVRSPKRGDILVFRFPEDESKDFIKRIIGTPGDVVEVINKMVYVNGKPIDEPYTVYKDSEVLPRELNNRDNYGPVKVPPGQYFAMGDNRDRSHDSRFWGFLTEGQVVGEAMVIYWSWDTDDGLVRWGRIGRVVK
ncbi:MAG: signal peptidase I [Nitrospirae bacterium]|nr:signal peptidase I [Nitrospirota bacterium]MBI5696719.1 signal peptidase I [Nitrospirota bacterium]